MVGFGYERPISIFLRSTGITKKYDQGQESGEKRYLCNLQTAGTSFALRIEFAQNYSNLR